MTVALGSAAAETDYQKTIVDYWMRDLGVQIEPAQSLLTPAQAAASTANGNRLDKNRFPGTAGRDAMDKDQVPSNASKAQPKDIRLALNLTRQTLAWIGKVRKVPQEITKQLNTLEDQWTSGNIPPDRPDALYIEIRTLRRKLVFAHPALDFERLLINRNPPTTYSHNGDQHLGMHSRPGPGLTILTNWKTHPQAKPVLEGKLPKGAVRNPDLNYDADKVVFAFCDHTAPDKKRFWLYEAAVDGSWVRQLTGTQRDPLKTWNDRATVLIEDNDPCNLPDGNIVFISTRSQSFGRCHGGRYNPAWVVHRCDKNGDAITQLSYANENEYEPSVLNDGRIVFTRWEYTNRHEMLFHKLWWCRPDGTGVAHYFGNDMIAPMEILEATAIPGTNQIVATAQGHHSYNTGTLVEIDNRLGENSEQAMLHITPETPYSETDGKWPQPHFSHPYPVTEDLILTSRANHPVPSQGQVPPANDRAIYLVDSLGGREFIYEDPAVASFSPIPIRKRVRPHAFPAMTPPNAPNYATLYVQNVALTRNDPDKKIKPGMIKAIRINALGVQPRADRSPCSMTVPVEIPKKILGTVPIDADGSAYFKVPAETSSQLQILDENGRAILTEKSLFYLQKGESRSCIGCHEPELISPPLLISRNGKPRAPLELTPPAGPQYTGGLSFMRTVQPVLDRYCISCHGLEKTEKGINLVHDGQMTWPRPLVALIQQGEHRLGLKEFMWEEGKNISRPFSFYAYGSKLPDLLLKPHANTRLDRASFQRIIDWLDLNAQCYGDLFPNKLEERGINPAGVTELRAFIQQIFGDVMAKQAERALINTAQPDESRILMMPLAADAGGWGQVNAWKNKNDQNFKRMTALVEKCLIRHPNENDNGWQPTLAQGGGIDWVIKDRENYSRRIKANPNPSKVSARFP
ncbi:MAG: hypothetical protein NTV46_10155 [Verrucomicrobia bacterium]|nr:hypothetical protein [Verrucomicrobiota bacterium]